MKFQKLLNYGLMTAFAAMAINTTAGNVDLNTARVTANNFLKQKYATQKGMFNTPAVADIKLAHTEASSVSGNAYYVFNINGGGWVIIAGDDRANQVLAYSDHGNLNMNNLPSNTKSVLDHFKSQIEKVQNYKGEFTTKAPKRTKAVEPLMKSNWGQDYFFCAQCPTSYGSACPVGCAGLAMAQILNYWEYPKDIEGLPGYMNEYSFSQVPALGPATFDYELVLDQYTYLSEDGRLGMMPGVTQANKDEVAKLCRYASQSCNVNFSSGGQGSGSNVLKQKNGFLKMGYSTDMKLVCIENWPARETWNTWDYTDEEWIALINEQLEAGHPIPYSSEGGTDGHAYVIDGVDADGLYHCNWGFYGYADGYYAFGAFNPVILGQELELNDGFLCMVIDLFPYEGYVSPNAPTEPEYTMGDVNGDTFVTIDDVTALVNYLLTDDATGLTLEVADCDGIEGITINDVTVLINFLLTDQW